MPKYPATPHLYGYKVNGQLEKVVRAVSVAEARDTMADHIRIELVRLTPAQVYHAAADGVPLVNAKPEYEELDLEIQSELFGASATLPDPDTLTDPESGPAQD